MQRGATSARLFIICVGLGPLSLPVIAGKPEESESGLRDIRVELLETTYRFENDGSGEIILTSRLSVLTLAGRNAAAQIPFPYSSQLEDLRIDYFRTVKKDGKRIDADPANAIEVAEPLKGVAPIFTGVRLKTMVAPQLEVGDELEYRVARIIRTPVKPGDFWASHTLRRSRFLKKTERVLLDVPGARKLSFKANPSWQYKVARENDRIRYRWELDRSAEQASDDEQSEPRLFFASTLNNWSEVGVWYERLQGDRMMTTPQIAELATKLTEGKSQSREKIEAIYAYVSEKIRYVAIEIGIGGYRAHAVSDVLQNGYGDCKDKAGLMISLLAAVGLKGYPALVRGRSYDLEPSVPMPEQFNHAIVAVPLDNHLLWVDPTLELAPIGLIPSELRGQSALVVEPGHPRLEMIPLTSPIPEREKLISKGELDAAGRLKLHSQVEVRGEGEVLFRQVFRLGNKEARKSLCQELARRQVSDSSVEIEPTNSDPADLQIPFRVEYRLVRPSYFEALESSVVAEMPASVWIAEHAWAKQLRKYEKNPGLKEDLKLEEQEVEEILELELDPAFRLEVPKGVHFERPFAAYDSSYSYQPNQLKVRRKLTVNKPKLAADRRAQLLELQQVIDGDLSQKLLIRRSFLFNIRSQLNDLSAGELNRAATKAIERDKDFALALDLLLKAVEKQPKDKYAWNNLGRAYMGLGKFQEAERAFKKQIEINPNEEYAYNNLGRIYLLTRRYQAAIDYFKRQLQINPLDSHALANLGNAYDMIEGWPEAADVWQKALSIKPDEPHYLLRLGKALVQLGKLDEAQKHLRRALEKDPSAQMANQVAYALAEGAAGLDWAERLAKSAVQQATEQLKNLALDPETDKASNPAALGAYLDTLGWVYYHKGQLTQSRPYLEAAYALNLSPTIGEHLARLQARQGDAQSALQFYSCAWAIQPEQRTMPKELREALGKRFGKELEYRLQQASHSCGWDSRQIERVHAPPFTFPQGAKLRASQEAVVTVLVGESGAVEKADPVAGDEPFLSAAVSDSTRLQFPPISWPGGVAFKTHRMIRFYYFPDRKVQARWNYGRYNAIVHQE